MTMDIRALVLATASLAFGACSPPTDVAEVAGVYVVTPFGQREK